MTKMSMIAAEYLCVAEEEDGEEAEEEDVDVVFVEEADHLREEEEEVVALCEVVDEAVDVDEEEVFEEWVPLYTMKKSLQ